MSRSNCSRRSCSAINTSSCSLTLWVSGVTALPERLRLCAWRLRLVATFGACAGITITSPLGLVIVTAPIGCLDCAHALLARGLCFILV